MVESVSFSGEPFIANPSLAFWYPVNWLFALIPYRFVYSWIIPIHIFWAMMGMFVLLRRLSSSDLIRGSSLKQILDPRSSSLSDSSLRVDDLRGDDTFLLARGLAD